MASRSVDDLSNKFDDWEPMAEDYYDTCFNRYLAGPAANIHVERRYPLRSATKVPLSELPSVFINNVPEGLEVRGLDNLFRKFGTIVKSNITSGRKSSTGYYGFITYNTLRECEAAIREMNGYEVCDVKLLVKMAKTKAQKIAEREHFGQQMLGSTQRGYTQHNNPEIQSGGLEITTTFPECGDSDQRTVRLNLPSPASTTSPGNNADFHRGQGDSLSNLLGATNATSLGRGFHAPQASGRPGYQVYAQSKKTRTLCANCNNPGSKRCGRCKEECYCSGKCQQEDWPQHKFKCQERNKLSENTKKTKQLESGTLEGDRTAPFSPQQYRQALHRPLSENQRGVPSPDHPGSPGGRNNQQKCQESRKYNQQPKKFDQGQGQRNFQQQGQGQQRFNSPQGQGYRKNGASQPVVESRRGGKTQQQWSSKDDHEQQKQPGCYPRRVEQNVPVATRMCSPAASPHQRGAFEKPPLHRPFEAFIVEVVSPEEFYIQINQKRTEQGLTDLADKLQEEYRGSTGSSRYVPRRGDICVAQFSEDNLWYRALALNIGHDISKLSIRFIDYGNTEDVPINRICPIKDCFKQLPFQSIACALASSYHDRFTPDQRRNMKECLNKLRLQWKPVNVQVVQEQNGMYFVKILDDSIIKLSAPGGSLPQGGENQSVQQFEKRDEARLRQRLESIEVGKTLDVTPSDLESAHPSSFYVQINDDDEKQALLELTQALMQKYGQMPVNTTYIPEQFDLVATTFGEDGVWYRAQVAEVAENEAVVFYCDYGNGARVELSAIHELDREFYCLPAAAVSCSLEGLEGVENIPADVMENFRAILQNQELIITVTAKHDGYVTAKLYVPNNGNDVNINEAVLAAIEEATPQPVYTLPDPPELPPGVEFECTMMYCISPSDFWVMVNSEELREFVAYQEEFEEKCATRCANATFTPSQGGYVAAKSKVYKTWYRARVLSVTAGEVEVHYIDYGNDETVDWSSVLQLDADDYKFPAQARRACLSGCPCRPDWSLQDVELFKQRSENVRLTARVESVQSDKLCLFLCSDVDGNIGRSFTKRGLDDSLHVETLPDQYMQQVLPLNKCFPVLVVHVNNINSFYVQLMTDESRQILEQVMSEVAERCASLNVQNLEPVYPGDHVFAKYQADRTWYRARVETVDADMCRVLFVDYGNSEEVPVTGVFKMEPGNYPYQAVHCSLKNVTRTSEEKLIHFAELVRHNVLNMMITNRAADVNEVIVTTEQGVVVNDEVREPPERVVAAPQPETIGAAAQDKPNVSQLKFNSLEGSEDVYILDAKNPHDVFLFKKSDEACLRAVSEQLNEYYENKVRSKEYAPECGELVCCLREGLWFRAAVYEDLSSHFTLHMLDLGCVQNVAKNDIMPGTADFFETPALAIKAGLYGIKRKACVDWSIQFCMSLDNSYQDRMWTATPVSVDGEKRTWVRLATADGSEPFDLASDLVKRHIADYDPSEGGNDRPGALGRGMVPSSRLSTSHTSPGLVGLRNLAQGAGSAVSSAARPEQLRGCESRRAVQKRLQ